MPNSDFSIPISGPEADDMAPVFDLAHLRSMTHGDTELENRLFDLFISSTERCIPTFKDALQRRSHRDWSREAHYLKGAAANLGALRLSSLAAVAECLVEPDWAIYDDLLRDLEREYLALVNRLRSLMESA